MNQTTLDGQRSRTCCLPLPAIRWALTALVLAPFRAIKPIEQAVVLLGIVALVVGLGGALALDAIGFGEGSVPMMALDIILPAILIIILFRLITNP